MTSLEKPSQISELLIDKLLDDEPRWIESGSCTSAGIDPFDPRNEAAMKGLCDSCPVFHECSEYRDDKGISTGFWAGEAVSKDGMN